MPTRFARCICRATPSLLVLLLVTLVLAGCGNATTKPPAVFFSTEFLWAKDAHPLNLSIPTTGNNPSPTVLLTTEHMRGYGTYANPKDAVTAARANGQRIFTVIETGMKKRGWTQLFQPTETGVFPQYVLYATFRVDSHYCFVEYAAGQLDQATAVQTLDVYTA